MNSEYIHIDMKTRRYEMTARRESTSATRDAIVTAAVDIFIAERSFTALTLVAVARRAGVTVKTVLRHCGSRDELINLAWARVYDDVIAERAAPPGDSDTALKVLIAHYERRGPVVLSLLAQEDSDVRAHRLTDSGRRAHRAWLDEVFGADLPAGTARRAQILDALVVATDVYCWKLLRTDRALSPDEVHDRMSLMTRAIVSAARSTP